MRGEVNIATLLHPHQKKESSTICVMAQRKSIFLQPSRSAGKGVVTRVGLTRGVANLFARWRGLSLHRFSFCGNQKSITAEGGQKGGECCGWERRELGYELVLLGRGKRGFVVISGFRTHFLWNSREKRASRGATTKCFTWGWLVGKETLLAYPPSS